MSIFFDFDVGPNNRRFRRAVDGDKYDIELFPDRNNAEALFGVVDMGSLIELSTLSICMTDENKSVTGFMALCDHPNVPSIDPSDWEIWIRNMFQRFYLSRNTLFIHFMCCIDEVAEFFMEEALTSVFLNDVYLLHILLMVPPFCSYDYAKRHKTFKRHMYKNCARRDDDIEQCHYFYTAWRQDFCPKLKIRCAVEEDNDDIIEILDKICPKLKELYGNYYISEIIGHHPESGRKIIVAENQDRAVGFMCLNSDINYKLLQRTYDLNTFYGLTKATPLEKECLKRSNKVLSTFGEPIMLGQFSPFHRIVKLETLKVEDRPSKEKLIKSRSSKMITKVNFGDRYKRSFDNLYIRKKSLDEYSDRETVSPTISQAINISKSVDFLDEESFEYDIVNIDTNLLTIPKVPIYSESYSFRPLVRGDQYQRRPSKLCGIHHKIRRRSSCIKVTKVQDLESTKYNGTPNAFMIELFGLREDIDDRQAFDLLEVAFEIMKMYEYCVIRVPCADKYFPLLQHFCFVPTKDTVSCKYSLYIAHRSSVLSKLRVRRAEIIDIPQISSLVQNMNGREIVWTVENCVLKAKGYEAYVLMSGLSTVGVAVLENPEEIDFLRAKFDFDPLHIHKYHFKGNDIDTGFCSLKTVVVYAVFEVHYRFFIREMLRLSGNNTMIWLTAYRNEWIAHKANCLITAMVPVLPRKSEIGRAAPELKDIANLSKNLIAFSTWFINKKLTSVPKINVDTRIVIIGSSRTAMGFLNGLLFQNCCTYLTFTNVTLISINGLPYTKHYKGVVEMMFPQYRTDSDKYLKSIPYTYYVNIVKGTMVEINKQEKFITLEDKSKCYYDLLILSFGKQYQHPDYWKPLLEKEVKYDKTPSYIRLDVPQFSDTEFQIFDHRTPENVFIINNPTEAQYSLAYVNKIMRRKSKYKILVYGASIHAYCCLTALLEMKVPAANIMFVESFPPENHRKTRIPVFSNVYVEETLKEVLKKLKIQVYHSFYFQSWSVDSNNLVVQVEFLSNFKVMWLECSAFYYYGKRGVNTHAYVAVNKSGVTYDGGILIDHQFRTTDPAIYAAGPATRYYRRYYAETKRLKYYDSYEVGEKLGALIRNKLDPLFTEKTVRKAQKSSEDAALTLISESSNDKLRKESSINSSQLNDFYVYKLLDLRNPVVTQCMLPGGLQYLDVRSPGMKIPHHYLQSLEYNGFVMETFKQGYFKLHLTTDLVVDGITCLTFEKFALKNFVNLYGLSAVVLNNVHLRYSAKSLDDFYSFFHLPWAFFLYHDHVDELFAMIKELKPQSKNKDDTLYSSSNISERKLSDLSFKFNTKLKIRSNFEKSSYFEVITQYVIEWLSENDILLPMYLQPWQNTYYMHDVDRNPIFKKKKKSLKNMLSTIV